MPKRHHLPASSFEEMQAGAGPSSAPTDADQSKKRKRDDKGGRKAAAQEGFAARKSWGKDPNVASEFRAAPMRRSPLTLWQSAPNSPRSGDSIARTHATAISRALHVAQEATLLKIVPTCCWPSKLKERAQVSRSRV